MIWWHKVLQNRYTVDNITPISSTPKDLMQQSCDLKEIDRDDLKDTAFKLVTMFVYFLCRHNPPFFLENSAATLLPPPSFIN